MLDYQIKLLEAKIRGVSVAEIFISKKELSIEQKELLEKQIDMLRSGYPLDFLLGEIEILGLKLKLNKNLLIPRSETEEWLLALTKNLSEKRDITILNNILKLGFVHYTKVQSINDPVNSNLQITLKQNPLLVDLGCGTGIIGLYLSQFFDHVLCVDITKKAVNIGRINAKINNITNIGFYQSNGFSNTLVTKRIKKICNTRKSNWTLAANLPYLPIADKNNEVKSKIKFEPDLALYSGNDGLDLFRKVLTELQGFETKPQQVIFELDPRNIRTAKDLLELTGYETNIWTDAGGFERVLVGNKS